MSSRYSRSVNIVGRLRSKTWQDANDILRLHCAGRGLRGKSVAIDGTICDGRRRKDAHVGTFMEAKLDLQAQHKAVVGQSLVGLLKSALCVTFLVAICFVQRR